jgi:hypothetical protein
LDTVSRARFRPKYQLTAIATTISATEIVDDTNGDTIYLLLTALTSDLCGSNVGRKTVFFQMTVSLFDSNLSSTWSAKPVESESVGELPLERRK